MNIFKTATLQHVHAMQRLFPRYQAQGSMDFATLILEVRARDRQYVFYPQFLLNTDNNVRYALRLEQDVRGMVGWLPYLNKRYPIGTGKSAFKEYCEANGLRTPRMWRKPPPELRDFVVKANAGSFGQGLRGPFRSYDAANPAHAAQDDGYYEAFIRGRILKAFFWEERLACLEVLEMPSVEGDGQTPVRELLARHVGPSTPEREWQVLAEIVAYDGLTLDAVPRAGQRVMFDFRYGSAGHPLTYHNTNALPRMQDSAIVRQLAECGPMLWRGIPEEIRAATLFSVDAIADGEDKVWLLEMNCNPVVHPDVYPVMLETLFGPAEAAVAPAQLPAAALPSLWLRGSNVPVMLQSAGASPHLWRMS